MFISFGGQHRLNESIQRAVKLLEQYEGEASP